MFLFGCLIQIQFIMSGSNQQASDELKNSVYSREQYARATFWEDRYVENGGFFDWYAEFPELKLAFDQYNIEKEDKILMVGCGNSKLSDQMYQNGYKNIVNIDISPTVINQMKEKFPYMTWEVMDATNMTYKDGQFDVILDKGTLDALISGKCFQICENMLKESMRVIKESGQILIITYGSPEGRRKIFENALPFNEYDYYQCRAELNDMSTMINLMRSNLPGQQLSNILKQQEAFSKTMREFAIIKMMRKSRKNQKQYIIWSKYEKAEIQYNSAHVQQVQAPQEVKPAKKEEETVVQEKSQEKPTEKKESFNYQPKKQPYVFVYSIRRKLASDIDKVLENQTTQALQNAFPSDVSGNVTIQVNTEQEPLIIVLPENLRNLALRAVAFLRKKAVPHPTVSITSSPQEQAININEGKTYSYLCLRKTNLNIKLSLNQRQNLAGLLKQLQRVVRKLIETCHLYPSQKTYELFCLLKLRKTLPTVNELMDKYWFPTWKINSINNDQIDLQFSIPPISAQKQMKALEIINNHLKFYKAQISKLRQGFVNDLDLDLYNIATMACLSYDSERVNLVIQDFWQEDEISSHLKTVSSCEDSQENAIPSTILLPKSVIEKVLVHIIGLH